MQWEVLTAHKYPHTIYASTERLYLHIVYSNY